MVPARDRVRASHRCYELVEVVAVLVAVFPAVVAVVVAVFVVVVAAVVAFAVVAVHGAPAVCFYWSAAQPPLAVPQW